MDRYTLGNEKNGPSSEVVKNKNGQILYTAKYEYDANGKLLKEVFTNSKNEADGEVKYIYDKNLLITEELFANNGELLETKTFNYTSSGKLRDITVKKNADKATIRYRIYGMNKEMITECESKWEEENYSESFSTRKDATKENLFIQEIFDEKKKQIGVIKIYLDKNNQIEKRENIQFNQTRMQTITYDEKLKVLSFSFFVKQEENWQLMKTHYFIYDTAKTIPPAETKS
jgi:hypothetical protein